MKISNNLLVLLAFLLVSLSIFNITLESMHPMTGRATGMVKLVVAAPAAPAPSSPSAGGAAPGIISPSKCAENWICTEWGGCSLGFRSRMCYDLNTCTTSLNKPDEKMSCMYPAPSAMQGGPMIVSGGFVRASGVGCFSQRARFIGNYLPKFIGLLKELFRRYVVWNSRPMAYLF